MRRSILQLQTERYLLMTAIIFVGFAVLLAAAACSSNSNGAKTQVGNAQSTVSGAETKAPTVAQNAQSTVQGVASQGASAVLGARTGAANVQTQFAATATAVASAVNSHTATLDLNEQANSGLSGKAVIGSAQGKTLVLIYLNGDTDTHPAGIYTGSCDNPGSSAVESLNDVTLGLSVSNINTSVQDLSDGNHVIIVNKSSSDSTHEACGAIPKS